MSGYYLGEIKPFGFQFAPKGWALCAGQLLSIAQNTALFSLLGTTYGGNGVTTFQLPDLRGRTPITPGQAPGGSPYTLGETGGVETVTLLSTQMPMHNHTFSGTLQPGSKKPVANGIFADDDDTTQTVEYFAAYNAPGSVLTPLNAVTLGTAGSSQPHSNMQPYLVINYCIALVGIYPSRN